MFCPWGFIYKTQYPEYGEDLGKNKKMENTF